MGTKPQGEGNVTRRTSKKNPEYYETSVEKLPQGYNLPDPLQVALNSDMGFEVVPGQDPAAVRVKIRCPWENYQKRLKQGYERSEQVRRVKNQEAAVDKFERKALNVQEMLESGAAIERADPVETE